MRTTTSSFGFTTTQIPISGLANGAMADAPEPTAAFAADMNVRSKPIAKPVAIALEPITKWRREIFVFVVMSFPLSLASRMNRCAYLLECAAAADISNGFINLRIGRLWIVS